MKIARIALFVFLVGLLVLTIAPVSAQQASVSANASGFGAAFAFAQNIGPISFVQVGTIGNAEAFAFSINPTAGTGARAWVLTNGLAAGNAYGLGTPWGTEAQLQLFAIAGSANGFAIGWR